MTPKPKYPRVVEGECAVCGKVGKDYQVFPCKIWCSSCKYKFSVDARNEFIRRMIDDPKTK